MKVVMDTVESLKNIISDIKYFLYGGINTLPLSIAGTMLLIGLFTSNYAMLFFLVGFLLVIPFMTWGLNTVMATVSGTLFKIPVKDICSVSKPFENQSGDAETVVISEWFAMTLFFFGYMLQNAIKLMNKPLDEGEDTKDKADNAAKVSMRKTQSLVSLFAIILVTIFVVYYRLKTGCEQYTTPLTIVIGILVTSAAFGSGMGWYHLLSVVGQDRLSDLFGIANRLLPPAALKNGPVACLPMP
jgi:H+/gluconate symporter-like permease